MKTLILVLAIAHFTFSSFGATRKVPDIPTPKLSVAEAIAVAEKSFKDDSKHILIGIDWCLSSEFQPRVSDGTQYSASDDEPNNYSWFITYALPADQPFQIYVIRVKENRSIGIFIGTR